jgi:hypothetical protein
VRNVAVALLALALSLVMGGCQTSPEEPAAADTDISIQTADIEALPVGTPQQCIERLIKVVDVDYLREHEFAVPEEASARVAIEHAIPEVCADAKPDEGVHEAAHEVIQVVEDTLADG